MSELSHDEGHRPSLFGPIVLIALGLFFLFGNLNLISDLHWFDLLRVWPLLLISLGLNILAQQAPRPYGVLLSGLVSLLAVLLFGYILIFGLEGTALDRWSSRTDGAWETQPIAFAADRVETAVFDIAIGPPGADVNALEDSRNLIEGSVTSFVEPVFETRLSGGEARVKLASPEGDDWIFTPEHWRDYDDMPRWQLGLNPTIPTSLSLVAAAGSSYVDLSELTLRDLDFQAAAGEVELLLPDGDYDATLQTNAASSTITLPANGRHTLELQVNAGTVTLYLPPGMEARVEVKQSLGSFNSETIRLQRVSGTEQKDGVWETAGYDDSRHRVDLVVHIALGSVTLREP